MVKRIAKDRPLSFEDVGVIGAVEDAVQSDVEAPRDDAEARAAARPADARPVEGAEAFQASGFDRVEEEEEAEGQRLPDGFEDWEGFKLANGAARENFTNVVLFPNFVFTAGGRYVDAQNVEKVFDVMPGEVSPDNLYLIGVNYLVSSKQRDRIIRGLRRPARAASQPNPLRDKEDKE